MKTNGHGHGMKSVLALAAWWVGLLGGVPLGHALELYISPQGNDAWTGTLPEPNSEKTDGPLATLERARDRVRAVRAQGLRAEPVKILLRGGRYELAHTLEWTRQDSGTEAAPVVIGGYRNEKVILSGGRRISGFGAVKESQWQDRLPAEARDKVVQANLKESGWDNFGDAVKTGRRPELFFNNEPMTLARWPNHGFVKIVSVTGGEPFTSHGIKGDHVGRFTYEDQRPKRWAAEPEIYLHGYWFWDWSDAYQKVKTIDSDSRTIELEPPYHNYGYRPGQRYYAVNLLSELDMPGEWYLDRASGQFFFWPPGPLENAETVLSLLPSLMILRDASWITIRGVTLEATRGTAMIVEGGAHNELADAIVRNSGSWALTVNGGAHHRVIGCELYQTGEGGVSLQGGDRNSLTASEHEVSDNHIHDFGRIQRTYRPAVGVNGVGQRVTHNLIHDGPHNAIQLGGNDHLIAFNEIHHVCYETGDVGAFYTGRDWTARGAVLRHNYFHDISGPGLHGAMAVYLDDAASGFTVFGNVFERAGRAMFIGGGRDNVVENNIFVDCQPSVHVDARGLGWMKDHVETGGVMPERLAATPYRKPPWSERYPELLTLLQDEPGAPKGNVIARNISVGGIWSNFEKIAQPLLRLEDNLINEDPGFVTAQNHHFQLRADSPAWKLGFKAIPFDEIGPRKRAGHSRKIRASADGARLESKSGEPFVAMGVNYYRPGTGWAPQVWKQFDLAATRRDFARMKELGINVVRVFLSYGSFYMKPGELDPIGLAKFDQFLALAEEYGIYVHPTGPDHWEGLPDWARGDRVADEVVLMALEDFWRLFAARYRGRDILFAYDLRNEPEVAWDTPPMRARWPGWLQVKYGTLDKVRSAWSLTKIPETFESILPPEPKEAPGDAQLLDYQLFRESVADEWTRRQVAAIKSVDPDALVTVGLIQWSVPAVLPRIQHYSGFRPERQARWLDFMEIHFYPLAHGAYEYRNEEEEARNLAYLECVVREVAQTGKPVIVAEFGWYGGDSKPTFDQGRHPAATEEQQARWCRRLVETTAGWAVGWLNWGFYDQPEARDVSQLTGLLTADGTMKAWGREFQKLAAMKSELAGRKPAMGSRPALEWNRCLTSLAAARAFQEAYWQAFQADLK